MNTYSDAVCETYALCHSYTTKRKRKHVCAYLNVQEVMVGFLRTSG